MIAVSKTVAVIIGVVFIGVTVAVGLLVYNYAEPGKSNNLPETGVSTLTTGMTVLPTTSPPSYLKDVRLPTHLVPVLYEVRLLPHVSAEKDWRIEGAVKIFVRCVAAGGRNVTVHVHEIAIDEGRVSVANHDTGERLTVTGFERDDARQFWRVNVDKEFEVGMLYVLDVPSFNATLNDQLAGFYRSRYDHAGQSR
jgi:hypothetical protein